MPSSRDNGQAPVERSTTIAYRRCTDDQRVRYSKRRFSSGKPQYPSKNEVYMAFLEHGVAVDETIWNRVPYDFRGEISEEVSVVEPTSATLAAKLVTWSLIGLLGVLLAACASCPGGP